MLGDAVSQIYKLIAENTPHKWNFLGISTRIQH